MDTVKICRLCLNIIYNENCDPMKNDISQILEKLLLKINIEISGDPVICSKCAGNLEDFFDFKCKCVSTENKIVSLRDSEEKSILDLKEVCLNENRNGDLDNIKDNQENCRFCMKTTEYEFRHLYDTKENIFIVSMLQKHIPELALNSTEELMACKSCFDSLQSFHGFITELTDIEEKITRYVSIEGTDDKGHIELNNIAKFTCNDEVREKDIYDEYETKNSKCFEIKTENLWEEDKLHMSIKTEEIDLKTELTYYSDSQDMGTTLEYDIPMYKCQSCAFTTNYRSSLTCHNKNHLSPPEEMIYECSVCTYNTRKKYHMKQHSMKHKDPSKLRMLYCQLCTYTAKVKYNLKRHMINHKNLRVKMYKCDVCSHTALHKGHLIQHMLVHKSPSEVTMYKCEECSFATKYKSSLQRHRLVHKNSTEIKLLECGKCSYTTTLKGNLKQHMHIHNDPSDLIIYKCENCAYETRLKSDLIRHILVIRHH